MSTESVLVITVAKEPLSYRCASSHSAQQAVVDFDDFLDCLTRNPVTGGGSRVGGNDDAALKPKSECGCSVRELDRAIWVRVVVGMSSQKGRRL